MLAGEATLAACGKESTEPQEEVEAVSVRVTPPCAWISGVGATQTFTAELLDADSNAIAEATASWTSQNTSVATMDESGTATGVAIGRAEITAEVNDMIGTADLTVSDPGPDPVRTWSVMTDVLPSTPLRGVWGTSSSDVYAVGQSGTILHYDGTAWSEMASGTDWSLQDVWGSSSKDVHAVGTEAWHPERGTLHYDGTAWTIKPADACCLTSVWGTSSSDVYAVGTFAYGTWGVRTGVLRYDGTVWRTAWSTNELPKADGGPGSLLGVGGTSSSDVYAVGGSGRILHFGSYGMPRATSETLWAVWGSSSSNIYSAYAVGASGTILHTGGSGWCQMRTGTTETLLDVWGSSPSDVYAVGSRGTILRFDGSSWTGIASGTEENLWAVWGTSSGDVYVVGSGGIILHGSR
jgi:hypothetical protein